MSVLKKLKGSKLSGSTPIVEDAVKSRCSDGLPGIDAQFFQRKMRVARLIPMRAAPSVRQLGPLYGSQSATQLHCEQVSSRQLVLTPTRQAASSNPAHLCRGPWRVLVCRDRDLFERQRYRR